MLERGAQKRGTGRRGRRGRGRGGRRGREVGPSEGFDTEAELGRRLPLTAEEIERHAARAARQGIDPDRVRALLREPSPDIGE